MKIQINTDKNIEGSQELESFVSEELSSTFKRFENAITRVEVHLSDANADKSGKDDKKCLLEARIANRSPVTVSHSSNNIHDSINGAATKLKKSLDSMVGKLNDRQSPKDFNHQDEEDVEE